MHVTGDRDERHRGLRNAAPDGDDDAEERHARPECRRNALASGSRHEQRELAGEQRKASDDEAERDEGERGARVGKKRSFVGERIVRPHVDLELVHRHADSTTGPPPCCCASGAPSPRRESRTIMSTEGLAESPSAQRAGPRLRNAAALEAFMAGGWLERDPELRPHPQLERHRARRAALSQAYRGAYVFDPRRTRARPRERHVLSAFDRAATSRI